MLNISIIIVSAVESFNLANFLSNKDLLHLAKATTDQFVDEDLPPVEPSQDGTPSSSQGFDLEGFYIYIYIFFFISPQNTSL